MAVDHRLRPHVPAELARHRRRAAGLDHVAHRVHLRLPRDGRAALLDVHQPVADARRDAARLEQRRQQHRVLGAVAAAGPRRLGRRRVRRREVLVADVAGHEVAQLVGHLGLHPIVQRLAVRGHGEALARQRRVDLVAELDHDLVLVVDHRRRRHELGVGELGVRRLDRVLQVDGHEQLGRVVLDELHLLVARRRQLELLGPLGALDRHGDLQPPRVVDVFDRLLERHEHRVDELGQLAVRVVLRRLERVLLRVERGQQEAKRHVEPHLQQPEAAHRPVHRVHLRHVDRDVGDLHRPHRRVDHARAVPHGLDAHEGRGERDDLRAELGPHRLHHDLLLALLALPRELEPRAHPAEPLGLGQVEHRQVRGVAVVRGELDLVGLGERHVHVHRVVGEALVVRHHAHAALERLLGAHRARVRRVEPRLVEDGLEGHPRGVGAAAHLHVHQLHRAHPGAPPLRDIEPLRLPIQHRRRRVHEADRHVGDGHNVPLIGVLRNELALALGRFRRSRRQLLEALQLRWVVDLLTTSRRRLLLVLQLVGGHLAVAGGRHLLRRRLLRRRRRVGERQREREQQEWPGG